MQVDVWAETEGQARAARQQASREVERDALEMVTQHATQPDVDPGHQRQRCEEVLAELPVGDPGAIGLGALERERVDEHWPAAQELHVVGRGVSQRHPGASASACAWRVSSAASCSWLNDHSYG